jgi:hypothetical protein
MKLLHSKLRLIVGVCIIAITASNAQAQFEELPELPEAKPVSRVFTLDTPIALLDANNQEILLRGMNEGNVVITFPSMPDALVEMPLDAPNMKVSLVIPDNYSKLTTMVMNGKYMPYYRQMKDSAGSLMRFLEIPKANSNFYNICLLYYEAAVKKAPLQEAVDLTLSLPLNALSDDFLKLTESLVYRTIEEGQFEETVRLLSQLNGTIDQAKFAEMAFDIAGTLRTEGHYVLASQIYGSLAQSDDALLQQKSLLWACYSSAVSGDNAMAEALLDDLDELDRGDENFLTYCLASGRVAYAEGDVRGSLRYLSRAMVLTSVEASFKPELYYLLINSYEGSGYEIAAERLFREFETFYPASPWLEKFNAEKGI